MYIGFQIVPFRILDSERNTTHSYQRRPRVQHICSCYYFLVFGFWQFSKRPWAWFQSLYRMKFAACEKKGQTRRKKTNLNLEVAELQDYFAGQLSLLAEYELWPKI